MEDFEKTIPIDLPPVAAIPMGYKTIDELQRAGEKDVRLGTAAVIGGATATAGAVVINKLRGKNKDTSFVVALGLAATAVAAALVADGREKKQNAEFLREREAEGVHIITS